MSKRKELYQSKCLMCGSEEFNFSTRLQVNHNMGKKNLGEVFGGEVHTMKFGKKVEPYKVHVGWNEFQIPFIHNDSKVWMNIECSNCGTPIKNKITFYGVRGESDKSGIVLQSEIETVMK